MAGGKAFAVIMRRYSVYTTIVVLGALAGYRLVDDGVHKLLRIQQMSAEDMKTSQVSQNFVIAVDKVPCQLCELIGFLTSRMHPSPMTLSVITASVTLAGGRVRGKIPILTNFGQPKPLESSEIPWYVNGSLVRELTILREKSKHQHFPNVDNAKVYFTFVKEIHQMSKIEKMKECLKALIKVYGILKWSGYQIKRVRLGEEESKQTETMHHVFFLIQA
ncbi:hypothetical protein Nepgr_010583 [Nepenthes gracilis]|uniref:Uncharacterized protein n=1 Tax=Nepenthes gracilis TaxID=150966 RepID=A0AAD3XL64_NEPGR|nr:hypothetical protein Nepgr_010583 [Nepenthes gracilis]